MAQEDELLEFLRQQPTEESTLLDFLKEHRTEGEEGLLDFLKNMKKPREITKEDVDWLRQNQEAKAQASVMYQFDKKEIKKAMEADAPSKWQDVVWGEAWAAAKMNSDKFKVMPDAWTSRGDQFFTKEFWSKAGKKWISDAWDLVQEEVYDRKARWIERTAKIVGQQTMFAPMFKAIEAGEGSPITEGMEEVKRTAIDYIKFIPVTAYTLYKDPVKTIEERGLDVTMLVGAVAGVKAAKGIMKKAKMKKQGLRVGDWLDPIKNSKRVTKQYKMKLEEIPVEMPIEFKGAMEVLKTKVKGTEPIYKSWQQRLMKNLERIGDIPDRPWTFGVQKGARWGLRTAIRVFEYYPTLKENLYHPMRYADYMAKAESRTFKAELKAWKKRGINTKSMNRVGIHADYMQPRGAELMANMGIEYPKGITPLEMKFWQWGQNIFKNILPRINKARRANGKKPLKGIKNYSTWIRNLEELKRHGIDITKADVRVIENALSELPFQYAKSRKWWAKGSIETNYGTLLEAYTNRAYDYIHKAPVLARTRAFLEPTTIKVDGKKVTWDFYEKAPRLAAWMEGWIDRTVGIDQNLPTGKAAKYYKAMRRVQGNIAMSILSFNVRSALIQPSALRNAYIYLGESNMAYGMTRNLTKRWRGFAMAESKHLMTRLDFYQDVHAGLMSEPMLKKAGRMKRSVAQYGMKPLQYLDFETARATWIGAYRKGMIQWGVKDMSLRAIKKKHPKLHRQLVNYADDVVVKTQASAAGFDIAPIQGSHWGKLLTMFQTFVINEWDMLTHDVLGIKNPYMKAPQVVKNVSRLVLSTAVVNALYEGVLKIRSPYPAPEWELKRLVDGGASPTKMAFGMLREFGEQLPIVGGTIRWSSPRRTAAPAILQSAFLDPMQMINHLADKVELTQDMAEMGAKLLGLPGASQFFKYHRRRRRGQNHVEAIMGVRDEVIKKEEGEYPGLGGKW